MARYAIVLSALLAGLFPAMSQADAPPLRAWQAKRIAYNYAIQQKRPGYLAVDVRCPRRYRCRVIGHEPGYLFEEDGPDVTLTLVERRRYALWVRDPFSEVWYRWL